MLSLSYNSRTIVSFLSSGNLKNNGGFLHVDRYLDSFVLLFCKEGALYIAQEETCHTLTPDDFLILFPSKHHYGWKASEGLLNYYWCHFYIKDPSLYIGPLVNQPSENARIVLPEYGFCKYPDRISLQFKHLIDISRQHMGTPEMMDFSISLLLQELSYIFHEQNNPVAKLPNPILADLLDFIQSNYMLDISVVHLARKFGYNADYLSALFKSLMGISLIKYINRIRIEAAKDQLLNSSNTIAFIAAQVGFQDEKYFMRVFRSITDMTPSQFRNTYFYNHINNK